MVRFDAPHPFDIYYDERFVDAKATQEGAREFLRLYIKEHGPPEEGCSIEGPHETVVNCDAEDFQ